MEASSPPFNVFFIDGNQGTDDGSQYNIGLKTNDEFGFLQNNVRRGGFLLGGTFQLNTSGSFIAESKFNNRGIQTNDNTPTPLILNIGVPYGNPLETDYSGTALAQITCSEIPATGEYGTFLALCRFQSVGGVMSVEPTVFLYQDVSNPGIQCEFVAVGDRVQLYVTGLAGTDIYWSALAFDLTTRAP